MDMASERVILEVPQPFANHNGGQLAFGPDGFLYWGLGDGGSAGDPQDNGQKLSTLLASILRLDVSGDTYAVPPTNPFVSVAGARPEKYAYGLRNPWRFSFDSATGDLWAGDVGQDKWEEIDRITAGGNYGWSIMEGFECYRTPNCDQTGLTLPRAAYGHDLGCSVTGGYVYRGAAMPELQGWYVYGDYCSGRIWALDTAGGQRAGASRGAGHPITSFGVLPNGEIVVVSFDKAIYLCLSRRRVGGLGRAAIGSSTSPAACVRTTHCCSSSVASRPCATALLHGDSSPIQPRTPCSSNARSTHLRRHRSATTWGSSLSTESRTPQSRGTDQQPNPIPRLQGDDFCPSRPLREGCGRRQAFHRCRRCVRRAGSAVPAPRRGRVRGEDHPRAPSPLQAGEGRPQW